MSFLEIFKKRWEPKYYRFFSKIFKVLRGTDVARREIELMMSKEKRNAIISSDSGHSNIKVAMRKKSPSAHNKETKILCSSTTGTVHRVYY